MHAADIARGRWPDLLAHFGIARSLLTGKHTPCPICGGRDRFRFDDKDGRGTFYCSHCGPGDGFALLSMVKGWVFKEAAKEVERIAGSIRPGNPKRQQTGDDKLMVCKRIWQESRPVTQGDPVSQYLQSRSIEAVPPCIRFHPGLSYRHDDGAVTKHPAMLAKVQAVDGSGIAIHRTYLTTDGEKAAVPTVKKIIGSLPSSSAVRLMEPGATLGITEGIETALCAAARFGIPVWAAISAGGLERWAPPAGTENVMVLGDNDASYTGQAAAFALAKRLTDIGIKVDVRIPEQAGEDWADMAN